MPYIVNVQPFHWRLLEEIEGDKVDTLFCNGRGALKVPDLNTSIILEDCKELRSKRLTPRALSITLGIS
jgi:hypothetical protein